jgi:hypothetical protein
MTTGSWDSPIGADDRPETTSDDRSAPTPMGHFDGAEPPNPTGHVEGAEPVTWGPVHPVYHEGTPEPPRIGLTTSADKTFRSPFHLMRREVPVAIYLSEGDAHQDVQRLVEDLLDTLDLTVEYRGPEITGSWFRAITAGTRAKVSGTELRERLQKLERGIELYTLHRAQAEVDEKQGSTVAQLLTALEGTPNALIQIGSLLIVKVDGVPAVRNLTQLELRHLEQNPQLLGDPGAVLAALQQQSSGTLTWNAG